MNCCDRGILCFQHLKDEPKRFCFSLPRICKFCSCELMDTQLNILPFRIPCPFKSSSKVFNSVVIKPTFGDFLNNYESFTDLHIGVTDSKGFVYEYDSDGLNIRAQNWEHCLPIKILQLMTPVLKHHWDNVLYEIVSTGNWIGERYNSQYHNCYSFVLSFLQSLQLNELKPFVSSKVAFCHHYVCPQTRVAAKYITIFRELKESQK